MSPILAYIFIFVSRIIDVTLTTIRTLMVVQGRKVESAVIGFFEITIYITVLGKVVNSLDNIGNLMAYALGFACGNYVGIMIENRIALGNLQVQIVPKADKSLEIIKALRDDEFAVTVLDGQGREGSKVMLHLAINRKDLNKLKKIVYNFDNTAFITANPTSPISGGHFAVVKRK